MPLGSKFLFNMKHNVTAADYSCCNESNLHNLSQRIIADDMRSAVIFASSLLSFVQWLVREKGKQAADMDRKHHCESLELHSCAT